MGNPLQGVRRGAASTVALAAVGAACVVLLGLSSPCQAVGGVSDALTLGDLDTYTIASVTGEGGNNYTLENVKVNAYVSVSDNGRATWRNAKNNAGADIVGHQFAVGAGPFTRSLRQDVASLSGVVRSADKLPGCWWRWEYAVYGGGSTQGSMGWVYVQPNGGQQELTAGTNSFLIPRFRIVQTSAGPGAWDPGAPVVTVTWPGVGIPVGGAVGWSYAVNQGTYALTGFSLQWHTYTFTSALTGGGANWVAPAVAGEYGGSWSATYSNYPTQTGTVNLVVVAAGGGGTDNEGIIGAIENMVGAIGGVLDAVTAIPGQITDWFGEQGSRVTYWFGNLFGAHPPEDPDGVGREAQRLWDGLQAVNPFQAIIMSYAWLVDTRPLEWADIPEVRLGGADDIQRWRPGYVQGVSEDTSRFDFSTAGFKVWPALLLPGRMADRYPVTGDGSIIRGGTGVDWQGQYEAVLNQRLNGTHATWPDAPTLGELSHDTLQPFMAILLALGVAWYLAERLLGIAGQVAGTIGFNGLDGEAAIVAKEESSEVLPGTQDGWRERQRNRSAPGGFGGPSKEDEAGASGAIAASVASASGRRRADDGDTASLYASAPGE